MIFVTVGTQLPFDRLVRGVDEWASRHPEKKVFVQLGETAYRPQYCEYVPFTRQEEWERLFGEAELVVSHAGMGTILKSLDYGKPLVIMPRRMALGEIRNDHQLVTVQKFSNISTIRVASDESELNEALGSPITEGAPGIRLRSENLNALIAEIQRFTNARA